MVRARRCGRRQGAVRGEERRTRRCRRAYAHAVHGVVQEGAYVVKRVRIRRRRGALVQEVPQLCLGGVHVLCNAWAPEAFPLACCAAHVASPCLELQLKDARGAEEHKTRLDEHARRGGEMGGETALRACVPDLCDVHAENMAHLEAHMARRRAEGRGDPASVPHAPYTVGARGHSGRFCSMALYRLYGWYVARWCGSARCRCAARPAAAAARTAAAVRLGPPLRLPPQPARDTYLRACYDCWHAPSRPSAVCEPVRRFPLLRTLRR